MGCESLTRLWREALRRAHLMWWQWAASEIPPTHPDVPMIVLRVAELRRPM